MPLRLFHIGFDFIDPNFWKSTILSRFFANPDDRIVVSVNDANVLVIGCAVRENEVPTIVHFTGIKLMYVGEPIGKFSFTKFSDEFFIKGLYNFAIGWISDRPRRWIKCPSYYGISDHIKATNALVLAANLAEKRACTLINRHDTGNTRLPILRELTSQGMRVVCPGLLANNCSKEELDRIGPVEYIRKFVFNICSENFSNCQPGYVTEKLVNCCLAGAIPIYFGSLDEIDAQVFNKERILFLTHENTREIADKVLEMCVNPELLEAFYRQPVFLDTAEEALVKIDSNIRAFFKAMSESFKPRSMKNLIF